MNAFRRCLEEIDVAGARRLWAHACPHLPQPQTDEQALIALHHARTQARSIGFKLRAWSHRWLVERGYPSGLPDELRPRAERMYPRLVEGVGIAVGTTSALLRPIVPIVQGAMAEAVQEAYADGRTEPGFVKARMLEAKDRTVRKLVGRIGVA